MYNMAAAFHGDVAPLSVLSLPEYFDIVRKIRYQRDPKHKEVTARPGIILKNMDAADCKKKAILMGAYFEEHGIPYRYIACSQRPDRQIHHVFTQAKMGGEWRNVDPTYARYRLFEPKRLTRAEILEPKDRRMIVENMAGPSLIELSGRGDRRMGFSIGKMLRKTKDAVGSTARAVQSNVLRPATGMVMDASRSSAGQQLIKSGLNAVPGGGLITGFLTKKKPAGGAAPATTVPRGRAMKNNYSPRPAQNIPSGMDMGPAPSGISMPLVLGGVGLGLGVLFLMTRSNGKKE